MNNADESKTSLDTKEQEGVMSPESTNGASGGDPTSTKLTELEAQVKDKEAKYLYLYADFENFKKRSLKERSDLMKFGWEPVALSLIEVLDNLERAVAHSTGKTPDEFNSGSLASNNPRFTARWMASRRLSTPSLP